MKKSKLYTFRIVLLVFIFLSASINAIYLFQNQVDKYKSKNLENAYQIENAKNNEKLSRKIDVTSYQNAVDSLRSEFNNTDILGTIKINDTNINTTIVQGSDNLFYLNHSVNKEENILGSVFMDYRNQVTDKIKLLYGHNSRRLQPIFHELEKFLDENFLKQHLYFQIMDETGLYNYKIFSVMVVPNSTTKHMQIEFDDDNAYIQHLKWLKENSKFILDEEISSKDEIVLLQTCYYNPSDSFIIIAAKKI